MSNCNSCNHNKIYEHSNETNSKTYDIILIIISIIIFVISIFISNKNISAITYSISIILSGYNIFISAIKSILKFKFQEDVLLIIAIIAAFFLGEFTEATIVTILFKLGNYLENIAVSKSINSVKKLIEIRPDYANILDEKDNPKEVFAKNVKIGEKIIIKAGEKVPLDSKIIYGSSSIDNSALTGESTPVYVNKNDEILSGSINLSGVLVCEVIRDFESSAASKIIELVYNSTSKKGKTEKFITKFSTWYTPIVIIIAILIGTIPPILGILDFNTAIMRSLIFLVASCPCALVISIPLTFFSSIGASSKLGVLVKGSKYIETISKVNCIALDKTGTITSGKLEVDNIIIDDYPKQNAIDIIASIESISNHPISSAILKYVKNYNKITLSEVNEIAGLGIKCSIDNQPVLCGSKKMMENENISLNNLPQNANVYLAINNQIIAYILMKEQIEQKNIDTIYKLKNKLEKKIIILSGDNKNSVKNIANICNIENYYYELLPNQKVEKIQHFKSKGYTTMFVGDGINDAPVIAASDIGASMGLGSEIANSTSDIVIMDNKLSTLLKIFPLSKKTINIVKFNIYLSIIAKIIVLTLGTFGFASLWLAVFTDIGISIFAVLNSIRILNFK